MSNVFINEDGNAVARVVVVGGDSNIGGGGGMRFLHGNTEPTADIGMPNDVYLNTDSGELYQNQNGNWSVLMILKGKDGVDGTDGEDGENGKDGSDGEDGKNGVDGSDGFPSEEQWNELVARVKKLEDEGVTEE